MKIENYHNSARRVFIAGLAVVGLTLLGIWLPEVRHYWVATPTYSAEVLQAVRSSPNDATLARLIRTSFEYDSRTLVLRGPTLDEAERILRGEWTPTGFDVTRIHLPFDKRDLTSGWPTPQLLFASLQHVEVLLAAFEFSGDDRFLVAARDAINGWAAYESTAILPSGYLWNDHAVAQRILVLTKYWALIRHSQLLDEHSAKLILRFIGRSGRILLKPDQYTVRTNHGMMENLALLHIAAAFPNLPDSELFEKTAVERLSGQLRFYQADEGPILEHSLGYHALGVRLLVTLTGYSEILDAEFNRDVRARLLKSCEFLAVMMRPDGSVPFIGNTKSTDYSRTCADASITPAASTTSQNASTSELHTYPVSGYGVAWYERNGSDDPASPSSQTAVAWGSFATRAHKHDDEMSIFTWHAGLPILTGVGYWPYGEELQKAANSWRGANGPFLANEVSSANRNTELLATGHGQSVTFMDLLRSTSSTYKNSANKDAHHNAEASIQRQVITLGPSKWLTVDYSSTKESQSLTTVWTLYPGWSIARTGSADTFFGSHPASGRHITASFVSSGELEIETLTRSKSPFAGWVAMDSSPLAINGAISIDVRAPSGVAVFTLWSVAEDPNAVLRQQWNDAQHWSLCFDEQCTQKVSREGMKLSYQRDPNPSSQRPQSNETESLELSPAAPQREARAGIDALYLSAIEKYPYWRDYYGWRKTASLALCALFVFQEICFFLLRRSRLMAVRDTGRVYGHIYFALRSVAVLCWLAIGSWLVFSYFGV